MLRSRLVLLSHYDYFKRETVPLAVIAGLDLHILSERFASCQFAEGQSLLK